MQSGSSTYRLEWINQGNHGEEVRHKLGAGVPVVEFRVGHQGRPQGGAHELLKVREHARDRVEHGCMSIPVWLAQPSSLTSQVDPEEARLPGLRVVELSLAGKVGHWPLEVAMAEMHLFTALMGTVLAYSRSGLEGLGKSPSLQAQRGQVNCLRSKGEDVQPG